MGLAAQGQQAAWHHVALQRPLLGDGIQKGIAVMLAVEEQVIRNQGAVQVNVHKGRIPRPALGKRRGELVLVQVQGDGRTGVPGKRPELAQVGWRVHQHQLVVLELGFHPLRKQGAAPAQALPPKPAGQRHRIHLVPGKGRVAFGDGPVAGKAEADARGELR